jgi:hypothetical protein
MYLLSRGLDPILGVMTGLLAFRISERNPRTAPAEGESLGELAQWKWNKWRAEVHAKENSNDTWPEELKAATANHSQKSS